MSIKASIKKNPFKWLKTAITILVLALVWIIPSNVTYLIAQNRNVLLHRYSLGHFTIALILIPIAAASLYLTWARNKEDEKQRQFKVLAITISILFSLILVDIAARILIRHKRYVEAKNYWYRPPNSVVEGSAEDIPEEAFLYPNTPPGYPDIEYTLTADKRGFRNTSDLQQYDIVTIGDSFTEGSRVTDEDAWPVLLQEETDLKTYNLGMSAGHPGTYFETLKKFQPELSPKTVVCLLYEGNDFREYNYRSKQTIPDIIEDYFRTSPIRAALKKLLIRCFGSTVTVQAKADRPPPDPNGPLSWLPVAAPPGPDAKYYTFKIKRLLEHYVTREEFLQSPGLQAAFDALRQINSLCKEKNIRLIIAFAPDKPNILLPLITQIVRPQQLRAFMALKQKDLPPADKLVEDLLARHHIQESAVKEFCKTESIEFLSLTYPLRKATAEGIQTYFTYDQHWTPLGHKIAAKTIAKKLKPNQETQQP
ncbi:MAG: alginate O-acetyltransferase AlgX-related protein [Planctomycetota bacterium]|jgi:hypothetical protein